MKKALVVFLALAMVAGVFADEPVADLKVAEFSGNQKVTWGVDLDSGKTGFKNDSKVVFKLNLFNKGSKSTTGDGVWGELALKVDSDTFVGWEITADNGGAVDANKGLGKDLNLKLVVDVAKIHLGPVYIGIKTGDTEVGSYKIVSAVRSGDNDNASKLGNVGPAGYKYGITAGYAKDGIFSIDLDFRSKPETATYYYTNAYALATDIALKMVKNANIKLGGAMDFIGDGNPYRTSATYAAYAQADYKFAFGEKFYVLPQIGYTHTTVVQEDKITENANVHNGKLIAGLLFGWGATADANAGVYFLDGDSAKKVTPGVGVTWESPIYNVTEGIQKNGTTEYKYKQEYTSAGQILTASFFSGEIVKNLKAAAFYRTGFGKETYKTTVGSISSTTSTTDRYKGYEIAAGANYTIGIKDGKITPKVGIVFADRWASGFTLFASDTTEAFGSRNVKNGDKVDTVANPGLLNLKAGVEIAGFVPNTTFGVDYASGNLLVNGKDVLPFGATENVKIKESGKLGIWAKIAL